MVEGLAVELIALSIVIGMVSTNSVLFIGVGEVTFIIVAVALGEILIGFSLNTDAEVVVVVVVVMSAPAD